MLSGRIEIVWGKSAPVLC